MDMFYKRLGENKMNNSYIKVDDWVQPTVPNLFINVRYSDSEVTPLDSIEVGDWIDVRSNEDISYATGDFFLIPLGFSMQLPNGYEAHLVPRSSTFKNYGVIQTNSMGIIDNAYCGDNDEWKMPVYAMRDGRIAKGDRVAQFKIVPTMSSKFNAVFIPVENLGSPDRGGFGSTGVK